MRPGRPGGLVGSKAPGSKYLAFRRMVETEYSNKKDPYDLRLVGVVSSIVKSMVLGLEHRLSCFRSLIIPYG